MIIRGAMNWAARHNVPPSVIAKAYTDPEYTYSDPVHSGYTRKVRGEHCLVVDQNGVILSILPADQAALPIEKTDAIRLPKARGGKQGNVFPTSYKEIVHVIKGMGYEIKKLGSGHQGVYSDGKLIYTLPSSSSDYRSLKNAISSLNKMGIDVRKGAK